MKHIDSLSVIIPAFNEVASLGDTLAEVLGELAPLGIRFEVIVVDDGSQDGSGELLSGWAAADPRIRVVRHVRNLGKGSALRSGLAVAACDWSLFIDADRQVPMSALEAFDVAARDAEILIGYRCHKNQPLARRIISAAYKLFVGTLFGVRVRDVGCPFKLLRTELARSIELSTAGFGFDVELLWRLARSGRQMVELPVESLPRRAGASKVTPGRIVHCSVELLLLRIRG